MAAFSGGQPDGPARAPGMQSSSESQPAKPGGRHQLSWLDQRHPIGQRTRSRLWSCPRPGASCSSGSPGAPTGRFGKTRNLAGKTSSPANWSTTGAIGGDKSWPAPSSDWPRPRLGRRRYGFDGSPYTSEITNGAVTLTGVVDADYQIRVTRTIELDPEEPMMRIATVFQRIAAPRRINPALGLGHYAGPGCGGYLCARACADAFPRHGLCPVGQGMPAQFKNTNGLISFTRDPGASHQLAFEANSLAWVGTNCAMRIDGAAGGRRVPNKLSLWRLQIPRFSPIAAPTPLRGNGVLWAVDELVARPDRGVHHNLHPLQSDPGRSGHRGARHPGFGRPPNHSLSSHPATIVKTCFSRLVFQGPNLHDARQLSRDPQAIMLFL